MKLDKLPYQLDAVQAVINAIDKTQIQNNHFQANPLLNVAKGIDVKMETGTGKTYVYTRLMHQLKNDFGCFKFILIVPSLAIKEGTKNSIQSSDWIQHFRQEFNNQNITLGLINAGDFNNKKGKRKQIPEAIRSFCDGSQSEINTISALLLNDGMLASKSMTADDYDSTLFGNLSSPIQGLAYTRPIVIIDEPHRFRKENAAWQSIIEGLKPQLIIRFGATFPEKNIGTGKAKQTVKDYENLVYELNGIRAFNENLVKGVHIQYPNIDKKQQDLVKFKLDKIIDKATLAFKKLGSNQRFEIKVGEDLGILDDGFKGLELDKDGSKFKLSNELYLETGMELLPQTFASSYQEILLEQALDAHFEKEKANFYREQIANNPPKIKTNSLFFIDSIASFRGSTTEEKGWLRLKFEELLANRLQIEIANASGEYQDFLNASLQNIDACIAGYFAEDQQKKGDEAIAAEVDDILCNKESMLKFKHADGSWNLRRFLFSKWALREGWDNPNVFVICKLRSSGSEISKLQEVGRGLRLPFDENGTRMSAQHSDEDFRLTYIVDFSEHAFAQNLIGEINADGGGLKTTVINEKILQALVDNGYASSLAKAKGKLLLDDLIDEQDTILDTEQLYSLLPETFVTKLKGGKITDNDDKKRPVVKLNKGNFEKIRKLWDVVSKRYLLQFEQIEAQDIQQLIDATFTQVEWQESRLEIKNLNLKIEQQQATIQQGGYQSTQSLVGLLPYGQFLKQLHQRTLLSINDLHLGLIRYSQQQSLKTEYFNQQNIEQIFKAFQTVFIEQFAQKYCYSGLDYTATTSIFNQQGELVSELAQGLVGVNIAHDIERKHDQKYLYDQYVYDSDIEHEILKVNPTDDVVVYGKLPRKSIRIPTYIGGTTSPDFIYAIKPHDATEVRLNLVVEAKSDNQRDSDKFAVSVQKAFFDKLKAQNIRWHEVKEVSQFAELLKNAI